MSKSFQDFLDDKEAKTMGVSQTTLPSTPIGETGETWYKQLKRRMELVLLAAKTKSAYRDEIMENPDVVVQQLLDVHLRIRPYEQPNLRSPEFVDSLYNPKDLSDLERTAIDNMNKAFESGSFQQLADLYENKDTEGMRKMFDSDEYPELKAIGSVDEILQISALFFMIMDPMDRVRVAELYDGLEKYRALCIPDEYR